MRIVTFYPLSPDTAMHVARDGILSDVAVQKMQYDRYHVKNPALFLHTVILFETVGVVLSGAGAHGWLVRGCAYRALERIFRCSSCAHGLSPDPIAVPALSMVAGGSVLPFRTRATGQARERARDG